MKPVFRNDTIIILTFVLSAAFFFLFIMGSDVSANSLEVTFDGNLDDVEGITYKEIEAPLSIKNTAEEEHNISISTEHPIGANTKDTINIYPQAALGSKGQGMYFETTVDAGKTRPFNILIIVNDSAFADTYSFEVEVTNLDDTNEVHIFTATVEILEYNLIDIRLDDKEDEKTIRPGKRTQFYVKLTNMGNLYKEKVGIEVDYPGNNFSVVVDPEYAIMEPISTAMLEIDAEQIFSVTIEALEEKGGGTFEIEFNIDTPDYADPPGGHSYISVSVIVKTAGDDQENIDDLGEESSGFPIVVFVGGLLVVVAVMGVIAKIFVLDKMEDEDEEDSGWGGEEPAWGAEEPSFETSASAEEFETPLTAAPPPRRAPQQPARAPRTAQRPRPSAKPRTAQRQAPKPGPAARPGGPAHVKCPKCHTGMKVSNPKRPLTISCPKCSVKFTLKGKPGAAPAGRPKQAPRPAPKPAARPSGPAHVKCPKCHTGMKVSNPKRPLTISCPKCSVKFTIKGKPGAAPAGRPKHAPRPAPKPAAKPHAGGPAHVKCPKCHTGMKVSNPKRPLTISCPKCSVKFTIKGKPGSATQRKSGAASKPAPGKGSGKPATSISCPKCATKFRVSNPKRPLSVACPKCKVRLNLK